MAKELPFFKWMPEKYITGDITLCSFEAQGIFANLCSFYWAKKCIISLANAKQRYNSCLASFQELLDKEIIKLDENENLVIEFLDEQMNMFINISEKRAKSGFKGGKAKGKQMLSKRKAKTIYKDKDKDKDILVKNQEIFEKEVLVFKEQYDLSLLKAFYAYWSEPDKKFRMKKELQKTWDTKRRLITWENNNRKFNKSEIKNIETYNLRKKYEESNKPVK